MAGGIGSNQIRDGSVQGSASNVAVLPGDIRQGTISTPDLRNEAVSLAKLAPEVKATLQGGLLLAGDIQDYTKTSTTSTTFQTKLTLTVTLAAGEYRLGWHNRVRASGNNESMEVQIKHTLPNASIVIEDLMDTRTLANQLNAPYGGGAKYLTLTAGVHKFEMQFRSTKTSLTAYIEAAMLELFQVVAV